MEVDSRELQRRRRMLCDVDAEREVEKVDLEQECRRNVRNGGVFLWLETETAEDPVLLLQSAARPQWLLMFFNQMRRCFTDKGLTNHFLKSVILLMGILNQTNVKK